MHMRLHMTSVGHNHGRISYPFRCKRRFRWEIAKKTFPPLRVFNAPDEGGVPLGNGGGAQKIVIPLPDDGKSLCTRLDTILDG